jgi:Di- and tripeptidases
MGGEDQFERTSSDVGRPEPKTGISLYFEELTKIPRCSGNEKQVSDYLVSFAKERKFEVFQDKALTLIIRKPGTAGYEKSPASRAKRQETTLTRLQEESSSS